VDALGNRTSYTFDEVNRQVAVTSPLGRRPTTVYDPAGQVTASVGRLRSGVNWGKDHAGFLDGGNHGFGLAAGGLR